MKILIDVKSGMNDCVSMLNYMLQYCHKNNISYDNIYFRSVLYEFSNYFDINTINYIKSDVIPKVELFNKDANTDKDLNERTNSKLFFINKEL